MNLWYSSYHKRNSSTSIICSSRYNNTIFWTFLGDPTFYFSQNTKYWTVSDRPRDSRPKLMFPAVTAPFLFQAFALSQCYKSSHVLNLKTPSLTIAYLAPSLCSIPKVFAFLSQCWDTVSNGFTHVMWCHLILLKLNPTHRMYWKAEDLEKRNPEMSRLIFLFIAEEHWQLYLKKKIYHTHSALWSYTYEQIAAKQSVFYSKLVF